ncbi:MAG: hypothetical protein HY900_28245, partial [Deltaproteobacteria bacterium]|nr:hypothetical protein [Deltaproteobacteria bacterium]
LVHFDDRRAEATLRALGELAKTVQVILFTHHQHVVDAARRIAAGGDVLVHELASDPG